MTREYLEQVQKDFDMPYIVDMNLGVEKDSGLEGVDWDKEPNDQPFVPIVLQ